MPHVERIELNPYTCGASSRHRAVPPINQRKFEAEQLQMHVGEITLSLTVDVRLQMAAITLAEEMNFTRAADRLRITQPALSKQIAELEYRVGFAVSKREQES